MRFIYRRNSTETIADAIIISALRYVDWEVSSIIRELNLDVVREEIADAVDRLYINRRPRKMLTWETHRRLVRQIGDCLVGDYCHVPEHRIETLRSKKDFDIARKHLSTRWGRRERAIYVDAAHTVIDRLNPRIA